MNIINNMKLEGKIAVIAGASGGIGREVSRALAKEGVEVILVARNLQILKALKKDVENKGGKASCFKADLTKYIEVNHLTAEIKEKYNHVDILFHCMGIGVYKKYSEIKLDDWQNSFAVNVTAVFLLTQKLLPFLKNSEKAYVVALGSGMGKIGLAERVPYCMSKFALRGLILSLAKEFKKSKIKFILLTLGSVLTSFGPLSIEEKLEKRKQGKKYLDPEWLAHNIVKRIEHDTLETETSIYPSRYIEERKEGKV